MNKLKLRSFFASLLCIILSVCIETTCAFALQESSNSATYASSKIITVAEIITSSADNAPSTKWTIADFTYKDFECPLYGCDYSRQFKVTGKVISGFSSVGEEKLTTCTDLVIPAKDPEGNVIVGIGQNAFYDKGLTSVSFPTGMMMPYNDTLTERVTKRGNFVIAESAFAKNNLKELYLPSGVLAVMSSAFQNNQLRSVTFPQSIWWIETQSFAKNQIEQVNFPATTDFHLEMHGMAFGSNKIKSIRLPDYTEVVNKDTFAMNPGMEEASDEYSNKQRILDSGNPCGVVYMYTDNIGLASKNRIHHVGWTTSSTKSYTQKLIVNDNSAATQNPDANIWTRNDFTFEGTTVTGLSESGIVKRKTNKHLTIPTYTPNWDEVTTIASTENIYGLFGSENEGFDCIELPEKLQSIGDRAFARNGIKDIIWSPSVASVGMAAFQQNDLTSVILPDTIAKIGNGAFASNQLLERVSLSSGMTEIADGAFGCSDSSHWMENWTNIDIPDGITRIGANAFAGNNFDRIDIPTSVKEIGRFAFSTKNYLKTPCTLILREGLKSIGHFAFRNKIIEKVKLPTTVTELPSNTFLKAYSSSIEDTVPLITKVLAQTEEQCANKELFPSPCEDSHIIVTPAERVWKAEDFTYGQLDTTNLDLQLADNSEDKLKTIVPVITGLSKQGEQRLLINTDLVIPDVDPNGNSVCGIGANAFAHKGLTSIQLPTGIMCDNDKPTWNNKLSTRGNYFIGSSAFLDNELTEVSLPEGTLAVLGNAFGSNQITKVDFPSTIFYIANQSFARNQIEQLSFTPSTDYPLQIAAMAFAQNKIRATQIPDNIGYLDKWAFFQNTGIEPVESNNAEEAKGGVAHLYITSADTPGKHVASLDRGTSNVQKLVEGTLPIDNAYLSSDFTYSGATITGWSDSGKLKRLTNHNLIFPDNAPDGTTITAIGASAFRSPDEEVDYDSAKYDYQSAYGIKTVKLPSKLEQIGNDAFMYNNLSTIEFPQTLQRIGETAFKGNHLVRVLLPDSITELGSGSFAANSIIELHLSKSLTVIAPGAFSMNIRMEQVNLPEGLIEIGETAFAGARLTSLTIPSTVTTIGRKAFHLHRMNSLVIPGTVKVIGDNAFEGTYKGQTLTKLTLKEGIESIGAGAFKEGLLQTVTLPSSLQTMGTEPFQNNTGKNASQIVELVTKNKNHLKFNEGATTHKVVLDSSIEDPTKEPTIVPSPPTPDKPDKSSKTITKKIQPLNAKAVKKTITLKYAKLRTKQISVSNIRVTKKGQGVVTYKNVSKNTKAKRFKVTNRGIVKVTKKLKRGTYAVRVKITAAGNSKYKAGSVIVAFKVKVK